MSSKELLDRLAEMKIPARNHASTLVEAYVDKIRKSLGPEIAERQAAMEAERARKEAEQAAKRAEEERVRAEAEEAARLEEEEARRAEDEERRRREADEREEREHREAEEAARQAEEERMRTEEEERRTREADEAARLEKEEEERYRQMAREAEAAVAVTRETIMAEAAKAVTAAATAPPAEKRGKKGKKARHVEEAAAVSAPEAEAEAAAVGEGGEITVSEGVTVGEFADALGVPHTDIIKRLMLLGMPLTVNQPMMHEIIGIIADDMERSVTILAPEEEVAEVFVDRPEDLVAKAPVVTVMGHVDHGKTSLLDAIRSTGVAATEAGGITQHIGASVVRKNDRQITFIDTPGHEAFTAMRARGAKVTDVAVLVVAADDGVMPQTVEAIDHAKAAGVPIVVAVNKIDKDNASPDRVRQELVEHEVIPEEWGGSNIFVDVSAKKNVAIDDLLEMILLTADIQELKANPGAPASGVVIEAKLDRGRGPVATVLVQRGTLSIGDAIVAGTSHGRVRALVNPLGENVGVAGPADPVEILGLSSVPAAGDEFRVMPDERSARSIAEERSLKKRLLAHERKTHVSLEDLFARISEGELKDLNLIVKADVQGSIEALKDALGKMDQTEVRINVIHSGVGAVTETDVMLADASDAIIIGFNVRPEPKARALAEETSVDVRLYRVIYQAIEDINAARVGLLSPTIEERDTARIEIRELFRVPKLGTIAGCYVTEGEVSRDDQVRVVREGAVAFEGRIGSLRRFKDDVKSVKSGYECGIGIEGFQDIKEGDVIEAFRTVEVAREA